jgi:hypothetical protein
MIILNSIVIDIWVDSYYNGWNLYPTIIIKKKFGKVLWRVLNFEKGKN